jgi:hypothetical protein
VEFAGNLLSPFPIRCRFPLSSADGVPAFGNQRQRTTNLNEALVMSTGPEDPPTHWKQVQQIYFKISNSTACWHEFIIIHNKYLYSLFSKNCIRSWNQSFVPDLYKYVQHELWLDVMCNFCLHHQIIILK